MKKYDLYKKTCDILYDAYFNNTLFHGNCNCCAVGNIIAANCGYKIEIVGDDVMWLDRYLNKIEPEWENVFVTFTKRTFFGMKKLKQSVKLENYENDAKKQIISSGYTPSELAKIEFAFENVNGKTEEDKMYNGLVSVLNCLKEIHEVNDDNEIERFTKHYNHKKQLA